MTLQADPGNVSANLIDCLRALAGRGGPLTALEPLLVDDLQELIDKAPEWKKALETLDLRDDRRESLLELLEYTILQKFPMLTLKEIREMLQLTPLEETVAGQELINRGREEGREEGLEEGWRRGLIAQIQLLQELLGQEVIDNQLLESRSTHDLEGLLSQLKADKLRRHG